ncbi:hypothetical protein D3874_11225 [Oleomonas cavernae]|uniref:Uncharacterized protein n=1 Tax=Oleomonas cavernae TaxID=2320859 RepID=A0A418WBZ1_9PROT|nr:hypothetical protein D3874_11225 [Oleomonas cavernae]
MPGWGKWVGKLFPLAGFPYLHPPNSSWPGEVPAIHVAKPSLPSTDVAHPDVDDRDKPGHDD